MNATSNLLNPGELYFLPVSAMFQKMKLFLEKFHCFEFFMIFDVVACTNATKFKELTSDDFLQKVRFLLNFYISNYIFDGFFVSFKTW